MKTKIRSLLLVLASLGLARQPVFAQSPWVVIPGAPNFYATAGFFGGGVGLHRTQSNVVWGTFSTNTGLGSSHSDAFFTTDNGQSWQILSVAGSGASGASVPPSGNRLEDMSVLDSQNAWLLTTSAVNGSQTLSRTTSGFATSFTALPIQLPAAFTSIHFFTVTTGIALIAGTGTAGAIYRTTDGGTTWATVANLPAIIATTSFGNKQSQANSLWMTDYAGALLRTADAGLTWTATTNIGKVAFEDALHGLAYSTSATGVLQLLRTADGGVTWAPVAFSGQPLFDDITAVSGQPGTYVSVGSRRIITGYLYTITGVTAITHDSGTTWQTIATNSNLFGNVVALGSGEVWTSLGYDFGLAGGPPPNQTMLWRYNSSVLATKKTDDPALRVVAYPNPTTGTVQLAGPLHGKENVQVFDIAGRLCQRGEVSDAGRTIDLSAQPAGLYQVQLTAPDGTVRSQRVSKLP